jgi:uncharacterized protein
MAGSVLEWFWDDESNVFYDTAADHEELITRPRDMHDNATPSGTSLAVELMLRMATLFGDAEMARRGSFVLETLAEPMAQHPLAFGHALTAADMVVHGPVEIALVGDPGEAGFRSLAATVAGRFIPSRVVVGAAPGSAPDLPLLDRRDQRDGTPTAYVCRGYACQQPVTEPRDLWDQLESVVRGDQQPAADPGSIPRRSG